MQPLALRHARTCGIPVAFTRQVAPSASMLDSPVYPRWIEGFEPKRRDMVFDRQRPSCYTSAEFCDMADDIAGNYVVAGQFGELSCLSTAIDALHRDHRPTFLTDALVSCSHEDLSAGAMMCPRRASFFSAKSQGPAWIIALIESSPNIGFFQPASLKYIARLCRKWRRRCAISRCRIGGPGSKRRKRTSIKTRRKTEKGKRPKLTG